MKCTNGTFSESDLALRIYRLRVVVRRYAPNVRELNALARPVLSPCLNFSGTYPFSTEVTDWRGRITKR